jgi:chromosome segregation ATPase
MTPGEFGAVVAGATAALGVLIKAGDWVGQKMANRATERRRDLVDLIDRQDAEIKSLRTDLSEERDSCDKRIAAMDVRLTDAERRVAQAERDRAQMEAVLYRLGWEKGTNGGWRRNGGE